MEQPREMASALSLMRMALALLDQAGDRLAAAAYLQHAIDTLEPSCMPPAGMDERGIGLTSPDG